MGAQMTFKNLRLSILVTMLSFSLGVGSLWAAEPAKVRVAYVNNIQSAALVQIKALAKEQNLDIDLIPFTRYPDVQNALAAGSVDLGPITPNGIPAAVAQGNRNIIAVKDLVYGGDAILVRKGVNVQKFTDLKGKKVGVAEGGIGWIMFVMLLEKNGMTYNDIHASNFSSATDIVLALKRGDMDAVNLWEPFVAEAVADGYAYKPSSIDFKDTPLQAMNGMLGASRAFVSSKPDTAVAALKLVLKAEQQLEQSPKLWMTIVRGYSKLSDDVLKRSLSGIRYAGPHLSKTKLDAAATFLFKAGIAKIDVTGKLGDTVNPSFLARATGKSEAEVLQ
jgi:sulfonate transport system substrate-binding protein